MKASSGRLVVGRFLRAGMAHGWLNCCIGCTRDAVPSSDRDITTGSLGRQPAGAYGRTQRRIIATLPRGAGWKSTRILVDVLMTEPVV
jgi:hypothetical protein